MEVSPGGVLTLEVALVAESDVSKALAAAPRLPLLDVGGSGAEGPKSSVAFVASPMALHALFELETEPPIKVTATDGGLVYEDECVELFLASPEEPFVYREIVVNPAGALYGAEIRNPDDSRATWTLAPGRFPEGLSIAVAGEPGGRPPAEWTALELPALDPLAALGAGPAAGAGRGAAAERLSNRPRRLHPPSRPFADAPHRAPRFPRPEPLRAGGLPPAGRSRTLLLISR